jgi:hypothetical protein
MESGYYSHAIRFLAWQNRLSTGNGPALGAHATPFGSSFHFIKARKRRKSANVVTPILAPEERLLAVPRVSQAQK